jgi:aubergine-like protein
MYPSSILKIAGISEAERRDGRVMREIATVTRIDAPVRKRRLQDFVASLRSSPAASQFLARWGFEVGDSRQPKGRRIAPPKLVMCQQRSNRPIELPLDDRLKFQGQLKDHSLFEVATFVSNYLLVAPASSRGVVESEPVGILRDMGDWLGMKLPQAETRFVDNSHPNDYCRAISEAVRQAVPAFVVIVLPGADAPRYNGVKDFLTVHLGIPSQFIKLETLCGDRSKYTNIAIQIAAKTGGVPYRVSSAQLKTSNTMVIGLAIQSARGGGAPVAAAVASKNGMLMHFYSDSLLSGEGDPLIPPSFIHQFMRRAIEAYRTENGGQLPSRVVVYRDGVSYGLMARVKKQEVGAIRDSLPEKVHVQFAIRPFVLLLLQSSR